MIRKRKRTGTASKHHVAAQTSRAVGAPSTFLRFGQRIVRLPMDIHWTTQVGLLAYTFASLGEDGRRIAHVGRTAMGMLVCLYPSGAPGTGRNYQVASVEQGKAVRRAMGRRPCEAADAPSARPLATAMPALAGDLLGRARRRLVARGLALRALAAA